MKKFNNEKQLVDYFRKQINKTRTFVLYSFENSTSDIVNGWPDKLLMNRVTNKLVWLEFKLNHKITPQQEYLHNVMKQNNYKVLVVTSNNYEQLLQKIKERDNEL